MHIHNSHTEGHRALTLKVHSGALVLTQRVVERDNGGGISAYGREKEDIITHDYTLYWTNDVEVSTEVIISPAELVSEIVEDIKAINGTLEVVSEVQTSLEEDYTKVVIIYRKKA